MRRAERFGVNVLGEAHADSVRAAAPAGADRFADVAWSRTTHGVPQLTDAIAYLEATIDAEHRAGDHWIVVGRVERALSAPGLPLLHWASAFARLSTLTSETT
jgi:flavin reductase (DIM6/NTAB) family NADH-FMN oxidoreductase RutF